MTAVRKTQMPGEFPIDIPGYRMLREIARGGMAIVYLAIQECFDREVAIKVLSPSPHSAEEFGERFVREAKIVAQLSHPHIVGVHDVGEVDGHYYIAMDYFPGKDLKDLISTGVPVIKALGIVREIASALDYAHHKGFIHRDVKPQNVFFRENGSAVLGDFGIAVQADLNSQITQSGKVIGTPVYMSPEQARGEDIDGRADLYALGVMFYEMLIGEVPFYADDPIAVGIKHVEEPVPLLPDMLMRLQPIIDHLMEKDPEFRYQSGAELIADLDELDEYDLAQLDSYDPPLALNVSANDFTDELDPELDLNDESPEQLQAATVEADKVAVPLENDSLDIPDTVHNPFVQRGLSISFYLTVFGLVLLAVFFHFGPWLFADNNELMALHQEMERALQQFYYRSYEQLKAWGLF